MMWFNFQSGSERHAGGLHGTPAYAAASDRDAGQGFAALSERDTGLLVLRRLIEDFGGEATGTSLSARIAAQFRALGRLQAPPRGQILVQLAELATCGAVTLEELDAHEVVARITAEGARLAYDSYVYGGTAFEAR